jgi:outer membrane cobalamin receptor
LNTQSIIQLSNNTGSSNQSPISIRGFGENATANSLILIDGYRFTNPNLAAPNLNAILMPDIDSIEIIPGSEGTLYGDQAVGGVLKITTKKPEKFTLKLNMGSLSPLHQLIALNNILKPNTHNTLNGQNNFHYYIVLHIMFH